MAAKARLVLDGLLLIAVVTLLVSGVRQQAPAAEPDGEQADQSSTAGPKRARFARAEVKDRGDFKLVYEPPARRTRAGDPISANRQRMECVVDSLNERIALPFDIIIAFKPCDEANAFYDDATHQITLCEELIDDYYDLFSFKIKDKAKLDQAVSGAIAFTFFHEMGHALIDAWNLPVTGKQEDAADQLSNLILLEQTEEGEQMALDGALSFKLYADLDGGDDKAYWDEHSLDEQRFYDILSMIYGHDPEKYAYLIDDGTLPPERAENCAQDYAKVKKSWQTLLEPFVKTPPQVDSKIRIR